MKTAQELIQQQVSHWKTKVVDGYDVITPCRCQQCKRLQVQIDKLCAVQKPAQEGVVQS